MLEMAGWIKGFSGSEDTEDQVKKLGHDSADNHNRLLALGSESVCKGLVKGVGPEKQWVLESGGSPWNLHLEVGDGLSGAGPVGIFCTAVCPVGILRRSGIHLQASV